jgi:hypothetical protein
MRYVSSEDLNHLNLLFHTRIRSESCSISRSGFSRLRNVKKRVFLRFHTHDRFLPGSDLREVFSSSFERFLFEPAAAGTSPSSKDRDRKKCGFLFIDPRDRKKDIPSTCRIFLDAPELPLSIKLFRFKFTYLYLKITHFYPF